jgi:hypothetical protein
MTVGMQSLTRDSIGEALRFVRGNFQFVLVAAAFGAVALALLSTATSASPALGFLALLGPTFIQAFAFAALTGCSLYGAGSVRARVVGDGARVWAAMAIIGFFLFIGVVVVSIPAMIMLVAGPLAPYVSDLQAAGQDQAAVLTIMTRFAEENPLPLLLTFLFFSSVWMVLTSRLYLAAPASVDQGRILSFETWAWTKGATLRIIGARLLLLLPANILSGALGYLAGRAVGVDTMDMGGLAQAASANPGGMLIAAFAANFFSLALFSSLEAGLSAALYKRLKPQA